MPDTTPHRATAEQWAQTEGKSPNSYTTGTVYDRSGLMWSLARCILELRARIEALEAATAASPEPAPAGSLVEAVVEAMKCAEISWSGEARAAIREVAEWLRERGWTGGVAQELEREAGR